MKKLIVLFACLPFACAQAQTETGAEGYMYQTVPGWCQLPNGKHYGGTHGSVVVDQAGKVYITTDSSFSIMVYSPEGAYLRSFDKEFSGCHGLQIREENGEEFIYAAHLRGQRAVKLKLDGSMVWELPYPKEANIGGYPKAYKPTGIAVAGDGSIFVTDGYGTNLIHKYDKDRKYIKTFGGRGAEKDKFKTPHGIAIDARSGTERLLVCDREKGRIVYFDLDGNFQEEAVTGLRRPCSVSIQGDLVAVAELQARATILDKDNKQVAHLGDNPNKKHWANFGVPPDQWTDGIFTAPHGCGFGLNGDLFIMDWNRTGRVTKLVPTK